MDKRDIEKQLEELQFKTAQLEAQLYSSKGKSEWMGQDYYFAYHVIAGLILGFFAATTSLLFNVVGSILIGQHPLELIRVYLTFPLGSSALQISGGAVLALGCCLYLATGSLYGMIVHIVLSRFFDQASRMTRWVVATICGLLLWLVNFYGVLAWLQPALFGGNWIVESVPFWVAALTHLVFVWTVFIIDGWGKFDKKDYV